MNFAPVSFLSRSAYQMQERLLKRPTFAYLDELERSQWRSREQIEVLQARKLARLLGTANAHCPWHAARLEQVGLGNVTEHSEVTLADLHRIPRVQARPASHPQGAGPTCIASLLPLCPSSPHCSPIHTHARLSSITRNPVHIHPFIALTPANWERGLPHCADVGAASRPSP